MPTSTSRIHGTDYYIYFNTEDGKKFDWDEDMNNVADNLEEGTLRDSIEERLREVFGDDVDIDYYEAGEEREPPYYEDPEEDFFR